MQSKEFKIMIAVWFYRACYYQFI